MLKKNLLLTILMLMSLCLLVSCMRQAQLQNYTGLPARGFNGQALTEAKVKQAILNGARDKGWATRELSTGVITATLNIRSHQAEVEIPYSASTYSIIYKNSVNLDHDAKDRTIHNQYNNWVVYLRQAIDGRMAEIK